MQAAAANMASMGMWPWTGAAYPGGTTDSTKPSPADAPHSTSKPHSDTKRSSRTVTDPLAQQGPSPQQAPAMSPSKERRAQALSKYKEKRRNLKFGKKIRYETRKALADSRPRVKGQFVKAAATATATPTHTTHTTNNTDEPSSNDQGVPRGAVATRGHSRLRPQAASADERVAVEALAAISNSPPHSSGRARSAAAAMGGRQLQHTDDDDDDLDAEAAAVEEQEGPFEDHADTRVPVEGGDEVPAVHHGGAVSKLARSVQGSVAAPAYCGDSNQGGKSQGSNGRRNGSDSGSNSPDRGEQL